MGEEKNQGNMGVCWEFGSWEQIHTPTQQVLALCLFLIVVMVPVLVMVVPKHWKLCFNGAVKPIPYVRLPNAKSGFQS